MKNDQAAQVDCQEVTQIKQKGAQLIFVNNRYYLAISKCTFCALHDTDTSDASSTCPVLLI